MKVVILAGGMGTRISEETKVKPKPLIKIGEMPIIWHIMKIYSHYGINDFVICCGYKGRMIKEFFEKNKESWNMEFVDTGLKTKTGGRLKQVKKYVNNSTFCFTYGDTVNNLNIKKLIEFHNNKKQIATVTACKPPEKYGVLELQKDRVIDFKEKQVRNDWVNGGFFVLEPKVFDYIKGNDTVWEKGPMEKLVKKGQLVAYKHSDFYQPMDTLSDKKILEKMWKEKNAPWKVWK